MSTMPEWMSDPLVSEIPEKKLRFLGEMFALQITLLKNEEQS